MGAVTFPMMPWRPRNDSGSSDPRSGAVEGISTWAAMYNLASRSGLSE